MKRALSSVFMAGSLILAGALPGLAHAEDAPKPEAPKPEASTGAATDTVTSGADKAATPPPAPAVAPASKQ